MRSCIKACKATRANAITSALATMDLNGNGVVGDGVTACSTLGSTCSSSGEGCTAGEFFCPAFAMASSPCMTELQTCKAACAPHDRVCLKQCRDASKQCLSGSSPDAGVPDAPLPPPPDAPTTTTYEGGQQQRRQVTRRLVTHYRLVTAMATTTVRIAVKIMIQASMGNLHVRIVQTVCRRSGPVSRNGCV